MNPADAHRHGTSAGPPSRSRVRAHPQVLHGVIDECSAHGYYKPKQVPPVSRTVRDTVKAADVESRPAIRETPAAESAVAPRALAGATTHSHEPVACDIAPTPNMRYRA